MGLTTNRQALCDRMAHDVAQMKRERSARVDVAALVGVISDAYYRCSQTPTRLHVSPEIHDRLRTSLVVEGEVPALGRLMFRRCPVVLISDLEGFRWVRELPNTWK